MFKIGDTLGEIAKITRLTLTEIVAFNELSNESDIYVGDILVIPNGVKPKAVAVAVVSASAFGFQLFYLPDRLTL